MAAATYVVSLAASTSGPSCASLEAMGRLRGRGVALDVKWCPAIVLWNELWPSFRPIGCHRHGHSSASSRCRHTRRGHLTLLWHIVLVASTPTPQWRYVVEWPAGRLHVRNIQHPHLRRFESLIYVFIQRP